MMQPACRMRAQTPPVMALSPNCTRRSLSPRGRCGDHRLGQDLSARGIHRRALLPLGSPRPRRRDPAGDLGPGGWGVGGTQRATAAGHPRPAPCPRGHFALPADQDRRGAARGARGRGGREVQTSVGSITRHQLTTARQAEGVARRAQRLARAEGGARVLASAKVQQAGRRRRGGGAPDPRTVPAPGLHRQALATPPGLQQRRSEGQRQGGIAQPAQKVGQPLSGAGGGAEGHVQPGIDRRRAVGSPIPEPEQARVAVKPQRSEPAPYAGATARPRPGAGRPRCCRAARAGC
jgi:hypothetical protein